MPFGPVQDSGSRGVVTPRIDQIGLPLRGFCPWIVPRPRVNLHLAGRRKSETPPQLFIALFRQFLNLYEPCSVIYTDGSRSDMGVGCALTVSGVDLQFRLAPHSSIFTAELYAIYRSLLHISTSSSGSYLICSDSLTSLTAIDDLYSRNYHVQQIHDLLLGASSRGIRVRFM